MACILITGGAGFIGYMGIGSNNRPEYISKISEMFHEIETVELNDDYNSTHNHLNGVPMAS